MPFYEYECQSCKYYIEVMQKISDPPLRKCPSCGKTTLKKLVSAPVFRLKGGGWYETDFKSEQESKRNLAGAEREDSGSTEAKTEETRQRRIATALQQRVIRRADVAEISCVDDDFDVAVARGKCPHLREGTVG